MEKWKVIPGYDAYEVSNAGRVRRASDSPTGGYKAGRVMNQKTSTPGYWLVALCRDGVPKWHSTHRLVLAAFIRPSRLQCNHKNGNPKDNRLENLEYVTAKQNSIHRARVLKRNGGFKPRMGEAEVRLIFKRRKSGALLREIAAEVGCTASNVSYILKGHTRRSVIV